MNAIKSKLRESFSSILPIALLVIALSCTLTPVDAGDMLIFLFGVAFLVLGMSMFTAGQEISMQPLGLKIGSTLASSGKVWILAFIGFVIGAAVTISEPDLQILADQIPAIDSYLLILTVSAGVGIFLIFALLRIVFRVSLTALLFAFYGVAFILATFVAPEIRSVAFDSGGVTTGPMTVPFLMSLGAGVSAFGKHDRNSDDSFGITALCSIGPILSVLILGILLHISDISYTSLPTASVVSTRDGVQAFLSGFAETLPEVAIALLPIAVFTLLFEILTRSFGLKQLVRIGVGILYVFIGLTVFLTGANVGFLPMGRAIGIRLADLHGGVLLIPVSMLLGYFIVRAEPSVYVLNKLVEQMSAGAISGKTTGLGLSVGVATALGLASLRILTDLPILWILLPGYALALLLSLFAPRIFVGIAFDSGGVASGTMMSAFVLPLVIGACDTLGGNIMTDAFGVVAFVAMAPIIVIEIMGILYDVKAKRHIHRFITAEETFIDYN